MKKTYLSLTIIGTLLPNIFVLLESMRSGNILLYRYPIDTFQSMFSNYISSAFIMDLLFIVALFLFWSFSEARKYKMKNLGWIWLYTFALGIAGGLPLFLYVRDEYLSKSNGE
ncbi:MAG: DUF2834 domain-containing protein [Saprospiraceae bacterium]|nr:DUF2834 domain-containing protein [Saprospiraceae bacterium]